jgi:hypothetical protein
MDSTIRQGTAPQGGDPAPGACPPAAPQGASAAPLAVGFGCALLATAFGWAAGWSLIAIAGGYVAGGMTGVLAGGLAVMRCARRG